jgi:hypothetical protein
MISLLIIIFSRDSFSGQLITAITSTADKGGMHEKRETRLSGRLVSRYAGIVIIYFSPVAGVFLMSGDPLACFSRYEFA